MINLTINGTTFAFPEEGDTNWGLNVTDWASAVTTGMLQKAGGNFTLLADVDFGATYGLVSQYYKSKGANVSSAGVLRLANLEEINWRNAANNGNVGLSVDATNKLLFNGSEVVSGFSVSDSTNIDLTYSGGVLSAAIIAGSIVNADISASAAIAQSKLSLSITNAEINAAAAIAYGKLALADSIVNADINSAAAIAYSKLTLTDSIVNADINSAAAIAYSKLNLSNSILNADINASAAIAYSKLAALTASRALVSDGSGFVSASSVTSTELGYVSGVTSAIQTQIDSKEPTITVLPIAKGGTNNGSLAVTAGGSLYTDGSKIVNTGAGTSGQFLRSNGASAPTWASVTATAAFNITSQSSTYSAAINDYILASGASFTITLPTAVGVSGQQIVIQHNGTSLTQVYTLNTTSGQTIGGIASGSYALYTNRETLTLVSDNANWQILDHKTRTPAISAGALTITGSTTNPTKGTIVVDSFYWWREGAGIGYSYNYKQSAAGANGSGDYIVTMPSNLNIDTTITQTNTTIGTASAITNPSNVGSAGVGSTSLNRGGPGYISVYSSTQFRVMGFTQDGSAFQSLGSGFFGLGNTVVMFSASGWMPIQNWQP